MPLLDIEPLKITLGESVSLHYPHISIEKEEHCLLMGPSGCGKSTLLSAVAGLLPPEKGRIFFAGQDLYSLPSRDRDRLRGTGIGFVFQNLHLVPSLTIRKNVLLAPAMAGLTADKEKIDMIFSQLGLLSLQHKYPDKLSQGERQRVAIARAIINKPSLIIADEPTSALDDENAFKVMRLLQKSAKETGAALLVATHDRRLQEFVPRVIHLGKQEEALAA